MIDITTQPDLDYLWQLVAAIKAETEKMKQAKRK
jgi:hypothetical protein